MADEKRLDSRIKNSSDFEDFSEVFRDISDSYRDVSQPSIREVSGTLNDNKSLYDKDENEIIVENIDMGNENNTRKSRDGFSDRYSQANQGYNDAYEYRDVSFNNYKDVSYDVKKEYITHNTQTILGDNSGDDFPEAQHRANNENRKDIKDSLTNDSPVASASNMRGITDAADVDNLTTSGKISSNNTYSVSSSKASEKSGENSASYSNKAADLIIEKSKQTCDARKISKDLDTMDFQKSKRGSSVSKSDAFFKGQKEDRENSLSGGLQKGGESKISKKKQATKKAKKSRAVKRRVRSVAFSTAGNYVQYAAGAKKKNNDVAEDAKKASEKVIKILFSILAAAIPSFLTIALYGISDIFVCIAAVGMNWYNSNTTTVYASTAAISLTDREYEVYTLFKEAGYGDVQIAAILGNIYQEKSDFDATYDSGNVLGIFQFTGGKRTEVISWCESNGYDAWSIQGQVMYAINGGWIESRLNSVSGGYITAGYAYPTYDTDKYIYYDEWMSYSEADDVTVATRVFCIKVESPYYCNSMLEETRIPKAIEYYTAITSASGDSWGTGSYINGLLYYNQNSYGSVTFFDGDTVATGGCGITCVAMVLTKLTGQVITPETLATLATSSLGRSYCNYLNGHFADNWIKYYNSQLGLSMKYLHSTDGDFSVTASNVLSYLEEGCFVMLRVQGNYRSLYGDTNSYSSGHFILLYGTGSNGAYVYDPATVEYINNSITNGGYPVSSILSYLKSGDVTVFYPTS